MRDIIIPTTAAVRPDRCCPALTQTLSRKEREGRSEPVRSAYGTRTLTSSGWTRTRSFRCWTVWMKIPCARQRSRRRWRISRWQLILSRKKRDASHPTAQAGRRSVRRWKRQTALLRLFFTRSGTRTSIWHAVADGRDAQKDGEDLCGAAASFGGISGI